ncbi:hypothetical protein WN944_013109 [Citrus x changshan-huyou]|uniref:Uncharacterized protein n=1 Tax=Citrus x changshan-huyou TaxID=2935761 RepID=A0AAP0M388_9ROSI
MIGIDRANENVDIPEPALPLREIMWGDWRGDKEIRISTDCPFEQARGTNHVRFDLI